MSLNIKFLFSVSLFLFLLCNNSYASLSYSHIDYGLSPAKSESKKDQSVEKKTLKNKEFKKGKQNKSSKPSLDTNKSKMPRLTLFIISLAFIVFGFVLIFTLYNIIGFLGFISLGIGVIALMVWLVFKEADNT
jgi:hypothetical protein